MKNNFFLLLSFLVFYLSCTSDSVVKYFEYPDHNVLNIGSQLSDLYITNDSNTLIAADKGNNRIIFIDVSSATSVPTTSTKESFNEITVLLDKSRKKEFEVTKATELPLMNAILGYMNIIRIYTTNKYKKKLEIVVKEIFEKEIL